MSDENLGAPQDAQPDPNEQPIEIEHIDDGPASPEPEPKPIQPPKPPAPPLPPVTQMPPPPPEPPRPTAAAQAGEPHEEDDSKYGEEVQKRIQQLRYLGHSERRAKEAVARERDAAITRSNELAQENERLRSQLQVGEQVAVDQALDKVAARIDAARSQYAKAHEAGNVDEILKAQEALASAIAERDRLSIYKRAAPPAAAPASAPAASPASPNVAPAAQELDPGTANWLQRNQWFFQPGYEEMHNYALSVHHRLKAQGIMPGTPREQEYFQVIDNSLKERFPEQFGSGSAPAPVQAQNPQGQNGRTETRQPSRPVTPTAGTRTAAGARAPVKVQLNQHQVQLCQRLGIKEEDYARELIKQRQANSR